MLLHPRPGLNIVGAVGAAYGGTICNRPSCQEIKCIPLLSHQCSQNQSWRQSLLKLVCSKGVPYHLEVSGHLTGLQVCLALIKQRKRLSHRVKQCIPRNNGKRMQASLTSAMIGRRSSSAHDHIAHYHYKFFTLCFYLPPDKVIREIYGYVLNDYVHVNT